MVHINLNVLNQIILLSQDHGVGMRFFKQPNSDSISLLFFWNKRDVTPNEIDIASTVHPLIANGKPLTKRMVIPELNWKLYPKWADADKRENMAGLWFTPNT